MRFNKIFLLPLFILITILLFNTVDGLTCVGGSCGTNTTIIVYDNSTSCLGGSCSVLASINVSDTTLLISNVSVTPVSPVVYNPSNVYSFNATFIGDTTSRGLSLGNVNYTLTDYGSGLKGINFNNLSAGVYSFYFWAIGGNNYTETQSLYFVIEKAVCEVNISLNDQYNNILITEGTNVDIKGNFLSGIQQGNLTIRDDGLILNSTFSTFITGIFNGIGSLVNIISVEVPETENVSICTDSLSVTITQNQTSCNNNFVTQSSESKPFVQLCYGSSFKQGFNTKMNEDGLLTLNIFNSDRSKVSPILARASLTLKDPNGSVMINDEVMLVSDNGGYVYYELPANVLTSIGEYSVSVRADNGKDYGFSEFSLFVTGSGKTLNDGDAFVYLLLLIAGVLLFFLVMSWARNIEGRNFSDNDGMIININNMKYVKYGLWVVAYLIVLFLASMLNNIANSMYLVGGGAFFNVVYTVLLVGLAPYSIVVGFIMIVSMVKDRDLKKLLLRGFKVR